MKKLSVLLLLAFFLLTMPFPAAAAGSAGFCPQLSRAEGRAGDTVELSIPYDGSLGGLGAFLIQVDFDSESFAYLRAGESAAMRGAYSLTEEDGASVRSVCSMKGEAPLPAGGTLTYRFQVSEDATPGEFSFSVTVSQLLSADGEKLPDISERLTYTVLPPLREEATLASLMPSDGTLQPEFSPDCFSYAVTVPFSITGMTFSTEPAEGAVCKVNRRNLGAGGSDTLFLITVTAEDGRTKAEYRIVVHREEKEASPKQTAEPKPEKTQAPVKLTEERTPSQPSAFSAPKPTAVSPKPAATAQRAAAQSSQTGGALPSIVVRNNSTPLPAFLTALAFAFACVVLRPLSRWLANGIDAVREEKGDGEDREK